MAVQVGRSVCADVSPGLFVKLHRLAGHIHTLQEFEVAGSGPCNSLPINGDAIPFETELFKGAVAVHIRHLPTTASHLFKGKKRLAWVALQVWDLRSWLPLRLLLLLFLLPVLAPVHVFLLVGSLSYMSAVTA